MTRTRRGLYSVVASMMHTSVGVLSAIVGTPLLLIWLGETRIGVVRVGTELIGYALLVGMGLDSALAGRYSKYHSSADRDGMVRTLRAGLRAYLGVAFVSVLWVLILYAYSSRLFGLTEANIDPAAKEQLAKELSVGLLIAAAGQCGLIFSAFKPLLEAQQRGYISSVCGTIGALTGFAFSLVFAYHGGGVAGQFAALVLIPIVGGVLMAALAFRRFPEVLRHPLGPIETGIHAVFGIMLVQAVATRLCFYSDTIIITHVMNLDLVTPFWTTQRFFFFLQFLGVILTTASWPALADLYHKGLTEAFEHRLVQMTRLIALVGCAVMVPAAVWNRDFVAAWTDKPHLYLGPWLTWLTAALLITITSVGLWGWPFVATGKVKALLPVSLIGVVVNVAVSVSGTHVLGVVGPAIGGLCNVGIVYFILVPRILQRQMGTSSWSLWRAAVGPWLLAVPYALATAWVADQFVIKEWVAQLSIGDHRMERMAQLAVVGLLLGCAALAYLTVALFAVVPAEDRREWTRRLLKR